MPDWDSGVFSDSWPVLPFLFYLDLVFSIFLTAKRPLPCFLCQYRSLYFGQGKRVVGKKDMLILGISVADTVAGYIPKILSVFFGTANQKNVVPAFSF